MCYRRRPPLSVAGLSRVRGLSWWVWLPVARRRRSGQSAKSFFRSRLVVFPAPDFDNGACVEQAGEPVLVEAFVAKPAVEGLDVGVLVRLTRFDQSQLYAALVRPSHHGLAAELVVVVVVVVVVGADHLRQAAAQRQAIQHPSHPHARRWPARSRWQPFW